MTKASAPVILALVPQAPVLIHLWNPSDTDTDSGGAIAGQIPFHQCPGAHCVVAPHRTRQNSLTPSTCRSVSKVSSGVFNCAGIVTICSSIKIFSKSTKSTSPLVVIQMSFMNAGIQLRNPAVPYQPSFCRPRSFARLFHSAYSSLIFNRKFYFNIDKGPRCSIKVGRSLPLLGRVYFCQCAIC